MLLQVQDAAYENAQVFVCVPKGKVAVPVDDAADAARGMVVVNGLVA